MVTNPLVPRALIVPATPEDQVNHVAESIDPIELLIRDGVSIRALVSHQLVCIDWLASQRGKTFRLCYRNAEDQIVTETTTAAGLLIRGAQLGWGPNEDEPTDEGADWLFEDAIHTVYRGVHWYASEYTETDCMLPLGLPANIIKRENDRYARGQASKKRKKLAQERRLKLQKDKELRNELRTGMKYLVDSHIEQQAKKGIKVSRRAAIEHTKKWMDDVASRFTSATGKSKAESLQTAVSLSSDVTAILRSEDAPGPELRRCDALATGSDDASKGRA